MFAPFLPFSSQKLHEYLGYEGTIAGAPERRTVREHRQFSPGDPGRHLRRAQRRRQRDIPPGERLAQAHHVRAHACVISGEEGTGPPEPGGDLIEDQQHLIR